MTTFLFVHGTGVREPGYSATFELLRTRLKVAAPKASLQRCYWGEKHGAQLNQDGDSIPTHGVTRSIEGRPAVDDIVALWSLLYQDPFFELRLEVAPRDEEEEVPLGANQEATILITKLTSLLDKAVCVEQLRTLGLQAFYAKAILGVRDSDELSDAANDGGEVAVRLPAARAIVAMLLREADEAGIPMPDAMQRDALVDAFFDALGGGERSLGEWSLKKVKGIAINLGTRYATRNRGALMDKAYPVVGDILLYQSRGQIIRQFIAQRIADYESEVVLLAHSLGGIACVDLLIGASIPAVKALITVGSQSPFFYEIGALSSCAFDPKLAREKRLPSHFPRVWHNFWDTNDLLAYWGERIFPGRVTDFRVQSGQPFPQCHSAYWSSADLWTQIGKLA